MEKVENIPELFTLFDFAIRTRQKKKLNSRPDGTVKSIKQYPSIGSECLTGLLKNVISAGKTRQDLVKKRSLCVINEHVEPNFNAVLSSTIVFQQPAKAICNLWIPACAGMTTKSHFRLFMASSDLIDGAGSEEQVQPTQFFPENQGNSHFGRAMESV